jgi:ubiquinone/menaquinone biosynthesis C-methylase UbiE/DNA-binding transcriptional ArsR family regulator
MTSEEVIEALRAAGEPTRLRILALLANEELAVMELSQILDQSQPRVSRHLKLLSDAGLIERFPDGAWVFYRVAADPAMRHFVDQVLDMIVSSDLGMQRDAERLDAVRGERSNDAQSYFERNAARWDEIRSLYVSEANVEAAILSAAGAGPFERMIDLGTGAGRMLALLGPQAKDAIGLDLSQQMLNVARLHVTEAGLQGVELRHGDIFATRLPDRSADLVVVHQVLHYLSDPASAVIEAGRLVAPGGRLLIIDFAPHALEFLREAHQHRRLGFSDDEMGRWMAEAGLLAPGLTTLPSASSEGLTVKIWVAKRSPADAKGSKVS